MKICILGWYGTETLGDRAILAGLLAIFHETFGDYSVQVGSLYPFLTRRTLLEDARIYDEISPSVKIDYFDVKNKGLLNSAISECDFVVMGGGPIMDLIELEIISYAFREAKRKTKKTAVLGCGIGPLYKKQFIDDAVDIFLNSDLVVLRDQNSVLRLNSMLSSKNSSILDNSLFLHDPAILPVGTYLSKTTNSTSDKIAVNFREFPSACFETQNKVTDKFLAQLLSELAKSYDQVNLVPMHSFSVGGDDRYYLSSLKMLSTASNVQVIHKPMNLYELFYHYASSDACIGMRYHSIVFQTLLNGNNYIFDYTDKGIGKISSFLDLIDKDKFYDNRYVNIQESSSATSDDDKINHIITTLKNRTHFAEDESIYRDTLDMYVSKISAVLS